MSIEYKDIQLAKIEEFQNRIANYLNKFNNLTSPYSLPQVEYLGSHIPNRINTEATEIYVAIPIKNQENSIYSVLETLFSYTKFRMVVGIVLDNCTDRTEEVIYKFISENMEKYPSIDRVDLISSKGELFEATSENLLFEFCSENYFMSLQADIHLSDSTFVERAIAAFDKYPNLLGLSGRAIVPYDANSNMAQNKLIRILFNLPNLVAPALWKGKHLGPFSSSLGYFGDISDYPKSKMIFSERELRSIYPGQAVIRGPLIWRADFYRKLNGLNDVAFFLGRDDCDLALRGDLKLGTFVAYLPCQSYSEPSAGTTRKPRTREVIEEMNSREELSKRFPGYLNLYWKGDLPPRGKIKRKPLTIN